MRAVYMCYLSPICPPGKFIGQNARLFNLHSLNEV